MDEPTAETPPPLSFDRLPELGRVELDRYCGGCGYNLRQQAVRREPSTRLLLCKCPECGRFEPANQATTRPRSWFAQLVLLLWLVWFAALGGVLAGAVGGMVESSAMAGDALVETYDLDVPREIVDHRGRTRKVRFEYRLGAMDGEAALSLALGFGGAGLLGAMVVSVACLFLPHWSGRGYLALAIGWPGLALGAVYAMSLPDNYVLEYASAGLKSWIVLSPVLIAGAAAVGGLIAIALSRPLARLAIRILLPQRQRGPFAYLWLVDGKTQPVTKPHATDQSSDRSTSRNTTA
ncbi:MAG: hypothetical protein ACPGYV_05430 [Phycisphaeraceae bacterium]